MRSRKAWSRQSPDSRFQRVTLPPARRLPISGMERDNLAGATNSTLSFGNVNNTLTGIIP